MLYCLLIIPLLYFGYHKSIRCKIMILSMQLFFKMLLLSLIERFNPRLYKIDKNKYRVSYVIGRNIYNFTTIIPRGPRHVLQISDQDCNDVTSLVYPWVGPNSDFHKCAYTPGELGYTELTFQLSNGGEKIFHKSEVMKIKN